MSRPCPEVTAVCTAAKCKGVESEVPSGVKAARAFWAEADARAAAASASVAPTPASLAPRASIAPEARLQERGAGGADASLVRQYVSAVGTVRDTPEEVARWEKRWWMLQHDVSAEYIENFWLAAGNLAAMWCGRQEDFMEPGRLEQRLPDLERQLLKAELESQARLEQLELRDRMKQQELEELGEIAKLSASVCVSSCSASSSSALVRADPVSASTADTKVEQLVKAFLAFDDRLNDRLIDDVLHKRAGSLLQRRGNDMDQAYRVFKLTFLIKDLSDEAAEGLLEAAEWNCEAAVQLFAQSAEVADGSLGGVAKKKGSQPRQGKPASKENADPNRAKRVPRGGRPRDAAPHGLRSRSCDLDWSSRSKPPAPSSGAPRSASLERRILRNCEFANLVRDIELMNAID